MLLSGHVISVLFFVRFTLTTGFYWSYTILFESSILVAYVINSTWFSWGVASLLEAKSQGLCLAQLCTNYRLVSAKCWVFTISAERLKKLLLTRWMVHCTAASWSCACPPEVGCLTFRNHLYSICVQWEQHSKKTYHKLASFQALPAKEGESLGTRLACPGEPKASLHERAWG